ncbi:uncharacterized protein [Populus alba]|uniref:Uncharacterized protein n=1 Tax=Populus alba TaxID=43335 RepID=A0A4U5R052_POPAL|nr:hypothetical protein D5086_0000023080 [Populus alba]
MAGNLGKEDSSSVQGVQDPSTIGGSKLAGNLGKEDPSSVQDVQDPSVTGSGHKRPRAGNKSSAETSKYQREKKKEEVKQLKAEIEELEKSNSHLEGQAFQLRMDLKETREEMKETREENINLKIVQKSQSDSIRELGKKLIASGEKIKALKEEHEQEIYALKAKHAQEIDALKEEHERQMGVCRTPENPWGAEVEMWLQNARKMNNPVETPATASQATSNFDNSDVHFASQMA